MDAAERARFALSALKVLGLNAVVANDDVEPSEKNLERYLVAVMDKMPRHLSAAEICTPLHHKHLSFLPPRKCWPNVALLVWIASLCRGAEPIYCAWCWRPEPANSDHGGAPDSQHIQPGVAIDLHLSSPYQRDKALCNVLHPMFLSPFNMGMGLGVGRLVIHVDFFSDKWEEIRRPRWWRYETYPDYRGPR